MPFARPLKISLFVAGLAVSLPTPSLERQVVRDAKPLSAAELEHRRLTQEGERASRAMPPSPRPATPPNNGIVQIPYDPTRVVLPTSGRGIPARIAGPTVRIGAHPPPPSLPPCFNVAGIKTANLVKAFAEVTWHVCVNDVGVKGLWVGPVDIKRTPAGPWMRVLSQAGLADIFVVYHDNSLRFYDQRWTGWLDQVTSDDAGPNGSMITLSNETIPTVVAEVRDRGVALLCKQDGNSVVRRGQEFVVWGVSDAGNYDNIVQMGFRDDGSISFRMGNTGYNSPPNAAEAHSHNALWRVDMDLNGGADDTAYWVTHVEPSPNTSPFLTAQDIKTPFGAEGARQWDYSLYSSLLIEDTATNAFGHNLGYEFTPAELGMSRHYGLEEDWTHNDVYVTVYHDNEFGWLNTWASLNGFGFTPSNPPPGNFNWTSPDDYLLTYLNGDPVANNHLVVWIKSSAHHDPTDEDRSIYDVNPIVPLRTIAPGITGITLTHWSGFDMEPHDLFDDNPLGGLYKCGQ